MAATTDAHTSPVAEARAETRHTRRALSAARGHLQKRALKLLGWLIFAFLLVKLIPTVKQAVGSLEHVAG